MGANRISMDEPMDSMNKLLNIYQGALHRNVEREKELENAAPGCRKTNPLCGKGKWSE